MDPLQNKLSKRRSCWQKTSNGAEEKEATRGEAIHDASHRPSVGARGPSTASGVFEADGTDPAGSAVSHAATAYAMTALVLLHAHSQLPSAPMRARTLPPGHCADRTGEVIQPQSCVASHPSQSGSREISIALKTGPYTSQSKLWSLLAPKPTQRGVSFVPLDPVTLMATGPTAGLAGASDAKCVFRMLTRAPSSIFICITILGVAAAVATPSKAACALLEEQP